MDSRKLIGSGDPVEFVVDIDISNQDLSGDVSVSLVLCDSSMMPLINLSNYYTGDIIHLEKGQEKLKVSCRLNELQLAEGDYAVEAYLALNGEVQDWIQPAFMLKVIAGDFYQSGKEPDQKWPLLMRSKWNTSV